MRADDAYTPLEEAARDSLRWDDPDPVKMHPQAVLDLIGKARGADGARAWLRYVEGILDPDSEAWPYLESAIDALAPREDEGH